MQITSVKYILSTVCTAHLTENLHFDLIIDGVRGIYFSQGSPSPNKIHFAILNILGGRYNLLRSDNRVLAYAKIVELDL